MSYNGKIDVAAGITGTFPTFTDNLDGTYDVTGCTCYLYDNGNHEGRLTAYEIAGVAGITVATDQTSYLTVDYNSGSPQYRHLAVGDLGLIDESLIIPVVTIYNEEDNLLHLLEWDHLGRGLANKLHARFVKTARFGHESGLSLSGEIDGTKRVSCTAGVLWFGAVRTTVPEFTGNTWASGERWLFFYHSSGSWTKTIQTSGTATFNNTQYDDGTDLQSLIANQYGVNWIFRDADVDGHLGYMLGSDTYQSLAEAIAAPMPAPPPEFASHGVLLGRIIAKDNDDTFAQVDSAFFTDFSGTPSSLHNDLGAIQGGTVDEYYHLTSAEHTAYFIPSDSEIYGYPREDGEGHPTDTSDQFHATIHYRQPVQVEQWLTGETTSDITQIVEGVGTGLTLDTTVTTDDLATVAVNAGGSAYVVGQVVSVNNGDGNGRVRITAESSGVVTGVEIVEAGSGYSAQTAETTKTCIGFLIGTAGYYHLAASWSPSTGSGAADLHVGWTIAASGTNTIITKAESHRDIDVAGRVGTTMQTATLNLSVGDFLYPEWWVTTTETIEWHHTNLNITRKR